MDHPRGGARDLSEALAARAEDLCRRYLPGGRRNGAYWAVGDVHGPPGRSLFVRLAGPASGRAAAPAAGATPPPASAATRSTSSSSRAATPGFALLRWTPMMLSHEVFRYAQDTSA